MRDHPIIDALVEHWPAVMFDAVDRPNPFAGRDRSGTIHVSDLSHKPPTKVYSARQTMLNYLGLGEPETWDGRGTWAVTMGTTIDYVAERAMEQCPLFLETQPRLANEDLRVGGRPDFLLDGPTPVIGDVKSTNTETFSSYYSQPDWPLSRAYFWRQLQAYLWLSESDTGVVVVVDAGGPGRRVDLRDLFAVRWFGRDDDVIRWIEREIQQLNWHIDQYEAATTDAAREAALPVD